MWDNYNQHFLQISKRVVCECNFSQKEKGRGWDGRVALSTGVVLFCFVLGRGGEEKEKEGIE